MPTHELKKCQNCGGGLVPASGTDLRCAYCGTLYTASELEVPVSVESVEQPQSTVRVTKDDNEQLKKGCAFAFLFGAIILAICAETNESTHWAEGLFVSNPTLSEVNITDSSKLQQNPVEMEVEDKFENARVVLTDEDKAALRKLASIEVDVANFRKLYRKTRKEKGDVFNYLFDKSSPRDDYSEGVYLYISKSDSYNFLKLQLTHGADKWIFTENVTFNADGKKINLQMKFSQERVKRKDWEDCDYNVRDEDLPVLIGLAGAKSATITFNGKNGTYTINITPTQQSAFRKMLQIYKGLLLGYDKD
ncbi:hypothetical protein ACFQZI_13500 [Mucilaginibacter lutimaris]|uniref:Zinc ribbon domain-containing protein n=1 Tax=Mucilaginibacter lutimaris TaxID=931629 RepID=A0ABW2ZIE7_9SPHI